jgi:hypothetical protein
MRRLSIVYIAIASFTAACAILVVAEINVTSIRFFAPHVRYRPQGWSGVMYYPGWGVIFSRLSGFTLVCTVIAGEIHRYLSSRTKARPRYRGAFVIASMFFALPLAGMRPYNVLCDDDAYSRAMLLTALFAVVFIATVICTEMHWHNTKRKAVASHPGVPLQCPSTNKPQS